MTNGPGTRSLYDRPYGHDSLICLDSVKEGRIFTSCFPFELQTCHELRYLLNTTPNPEIKCKSVGRVDRSGSRKVHLIHLNIISCCPHTIEDSIGESFPSLIPRLIYLRLSFAVSGLSTSRSFDEYQINILLYIHNVLYKHCWYPTRGYFGSFETNVSLYASASIISH